MSFEDKLNKKGKATADKLLKDSQLETGTTIITENGEQITVDKVLMDAMLEYVNKKVIKEKVEDREEKTTIYLEKDVADRLNQICYKKSGLKKILVNHALKAILNSGKAEEIAENFDKLKKNKKNYEKRYYENLLENLGVSKGKESE